MLTLTAAFLISACGESAVVEPASVNAAPAVEAPAAAPPARQAAARAMGDESGLLPPESAVVDGEASAGERQLMFNSASPPARILAWYRARARSGAIAVGSEMQEGAEHILTGTLARSREMFTVRLAPGENGGTAAMLLISPR